jgi:hypothetical protein
MNIVLPPGFVTPKSTSLRDWRAERPVVSAAGSPFLLAAHAAASEIDNTPVRDLLRQRFDPPGASHQGAISWREKHYPTDFVPESILAPVMEADREYRTWDSILDPRAGNALLCCPSLTQPRNFYNLLSPQGALLDQLVATTVQMDVDGTEECGQKHLRSQRSNAIPVCGQIRQLLAPPSGNMIFCRSAAHLNVVRLREEQGVSNNWNEEEWSDDDDDESRSDDDAEEEEADYGSSRRRKKRRRDLVMPQCKVSLTDYNVCVWTVYLTNSR